MGKFENGRERPVAHPRFVTTYPQYLTSLDGVVTSHPALVHGHGMMDIVGNHRTPHKNGRCGLGRGCRPHGHGFLAFRCRVAGVVMTLTFSCVFQPEPASEGRWKF